MAENALIKHIPFVGEKSSVYCIVSPVENLRYVEENGVIRYISDVNLLMNSERIRNVLGDEVYLNLVRSISPSKTPYVSGAYTDDQLFTAIKSRFIQSPSEVLGWIDELSRSEGDLREQALLIKQQLKEQQDQNSQNNQDQSKTE